MLATNTDLAVAVAFAVMGGFVIYLANTREMTSGPRFQVAIGRFPERGFARIEAWTDPVPEPVLGLAVLALAAVFVGATLRHRGRSRQLVEGDSCHAKAPALTLTERP